MLPQSSFRNISFNLDEEFFFIFFLNEVQYIKLRLISCNMLQFLSCRINVPRKQGGLGEMKIPLVADLTKAISRDYGVLKEDDGVAYRSGRLLVSPSTLPVLWSHQCGGTERGARLDFKCCNLPLCLSGVCLWLTTRASWGRSPSMTCPLVVLLMKLCAWSRPSSTPTKTEKVI